MSKVQMRLIAGLALLISLFGAGCKSQASRDAWAAPSAWKAHKPVIVGGQLTDWADAPEFLHWRNADRATDGFAGKVLTVTLTGPFIDGALSQHAGAIFTWPRQIPIDQPFPVTFKARSLTGPKNMTVLRTWGGAKPVQPFPITTEWHKYRTVLTPQSPTNSVTISLVANPGGFQQYCAGSFELTDVHVDSSPSR